jgi:osmoprotectant transport system permease protein
VTGFLAQYGDQILSLTFEHLWLTGAAMLFAIAIGVPAGIWLTRHTNWAKPVLGFVNIVQTIPSLAMFGFLLPLPWLGENAARIAIVALFKVELPLAAGVILAGLRTATVTCVGIATIAAAVGAGGLGEFIFRGVASVDNRLVLAGAIPAALLALGADALLGLVEHWLRVPGAAKP